MKNVQNKIKRPFDDETVPNSQNKKLKSPTSPNSLSTPIQ